MKSYLIITFIILLNAINAQESKNSVLQEVDPSLFENPNLSTAPKSPNKLDT